MSDTIMVFSRIDAEGFDDFMADPELVLAVVEDMGFDQEDLAKNPGPEALYAMMEGRWSGEQRNFSFEKSWPALKQSFADNEALKLIETGGRNSQIYNEEGPITVYTPDQVARIDDGLSGLEITAVGLSDEEFALKDLFPALQRFFQLANIEEQFVLITQM